jgi:hypothetical protein
MTIDPYIIWSGIGSFGLTLALFYIIAQLLVQLLRIERMLARVRFKLLIYPRSSVTNHKGESSMDITAGSTGVFLGTVTASDGSSVSTSNWNWTSSDPAVSIVPDPADTSGATVDVTVPASDVATTFTLTATASATSTTETNPQSVTASVDITVNPAAAPVTFTMTITEKV